MVGTGVGHGVVAGGCRWPLGVVGGILDRGFVSNDSADHYDEELLSSKPSDFDSEHRKSELIWDVGPTVPVRLLYNEE